jgi:hypothetical protein
MGFQQGGTCNHHPGFNIQYFMTQRIRPDAEKYIDKLSVLHKMLQAAMKCKQSTDLANVQTLRSLLKAFEILYFGQSHH